VEADPVVLADREEALDRAEVRVVRVEELPAGLAGQSDRLEDREVPVVAVRAAD
jgi:hypothetical protein